MANLERFPLDKVAQVIGTRGFGRVVLQFTDENLQYCVDIYTTLSSLLGEDVSLFIAADSTYGSSVDDISALHVDSDLLVYFGSDLSGSGAMPVLIVPMVVNVDVTDSCAQISASLESPALASCTEALVLYEPGCHYAVADIVSKLKKLHPQMSLDAATLPNCANIDFWLGVNNVVDPAPLRNELSDHVVLGGLLCKKGRSNSDTIRTLIYIGDKTEQLDCILLHLSQSPLLHYSPRHSRLSPLVGCETKVFRQRYLGVQSCASASIIGIIVGSMGLTGVSTQQIIRRLQILIETAGKRHYTFIMGRLNEAKICNFPEVDVFVLVSNEDTALVEPKTFQRPVVTSWELELGLGAREWDSSYQSRPTAIMSDSTQSCQGEEWERVLQRVRDARPEGNGIDDVEEESSETRDAEGACAAESTVLVNKGSQALTVFHSAAAEVLAQREYQGLLPDVDPEHPVEIRQGLFGVAAGYERDER